MKLLFKQRVFSWFDSYDIYNEHGETVFTVCGKLAWGHRLEVSNRNGQHIATLNQKVMSFLPCFEILINDTYVGKITKELTFFKPSFSVDFNGWRVSGSPWEWNYSIMSGSREIANISKQLFNWSDTYIIDVDKDSDDLMALMVVLAIDAVKCSQD